MKILGISNNTFVGVTVATKAICTDYYPVPHLTHTTQVENMANALVNFKPDILVIGGWSRGYYELVKLLKRKGRSFPILAVYHGTFSHGKAFDDDAYFTEMNQAEQGNEIDLLGFVHPKMAEYFKDIRKRKTAFVPHAFKPQPRISKRPDFKIGVLGGSAVMKNSEVAQTIARDFSLTRPNVSLMTNNNYDKAQHIFLEELNKCSVLLHLSHLECYSNLIQEAWARGIPAIMSPANTGLVCTPLLNPSECTPFLTGLLDNGIDPVAIYQTLDYIHQNWEMVSSRTHEAYKLLYARTQEYLNEFFFTLHDAYRKKNYDVFRSISTESISSDELPSVNPAIEARLEPSKVLQPGGFEFKTKPPASQVSKK